MANLAISTLTLTLPYSDYTDYVIDMSAVPGWDGTLRQLRFDPAGASGTFGMDYIAVLSSPTASAEGSSVTVASASLLAAASRPDITSRWRSYLPQMVGAIRLRRP